IKNRFHAGQYEEARKRLAKFPTQDVPDRVQADMREMRIRLKSMTDLIAEAKKALQEQSKAVTTAQGRSLASAAAVILKELHPATVDRLDAFLGQVRESHRRTLRKQKQVLTPEGLLSLAITGWLLGSPSAEAQPVAAVNLWKT